MRTEIATLGEFGLIDRLTEGIKPENESVSYTHLTLPTSLQV